MENNFDAPYRKATWLGEPTEAFKPGKDYFIHIQKMLDGRYQVFKTLHHYREPHTGHKVYNDLESINKQFKIHDNENS